MIDIEAKNLERWLKRVSVDLEGPITDGAVGIAAAIQHVIAPYPPVSRRPQPFKSVRQRRGFFAALRRGRIEVPYRRGRSPGSETLGRRWNIRPLSFGAVLENRARYAGLVHGKKGRQAAYHARTGWVREDQAKEQIFASGEANEIMAESITRAIKKG